MPATRGIETKKKKKYSANQANRALDEYWETRDAEKPPSIRLISKRYGIPRGSLGQWIADGVKKYEEVKKSGPEPYLGSQQEEALAEYCRARYAVSLPVSQTEFRSIANRAVIRHAGDRVNNKAGLSYSWHQRYKKRNPNLVPRSRSRLSKTRASGANVNVIKQYFKNVKNFIEKYRPRYIYNCDETMTSDDGKCRGKVLAPKGARTVFDRSCDWTKEHITLLACPGIDTATNTVLHAPPLLIFKGRRNNPAWYEGVPKDWKCCVTENGWIETEKFDAWLQAFLEHVHSRKEPGYENRENVVLCMDNHDTHLSAELHKQLSEEGIFICFFPPNTTHILQACDIGFFNIFKRHLNNSIQTAKSERFNLEIGKAEIGKFIADAYAQVTDDSVRYAFKETGLWPLDHNVVLEKLQQEQNPSALTARSTGPKNPNQAERKEPPIQIQSATIQVQDEPPVASNIQPANLTMEDVLANNAKLQQELNEVRREKRVLQHQVDKMMSKEGTQEAFVGYLFAQSPKYDPELAKKKKRTGAMPHSGILSTEELDALVKEQQAAKLAAQAKKKSRKKRVVKEIIDVSDVSESTTPAAKRPKVLRIKAGGCTTSLDSTGGATEPSGENDISQSSVLRLRIPLSSISTNISLPNAVPRLGNLPEPHDQMTEENGKREKQYGRGSNENA